MASVVVIDRDAEGNEQEFARLDIPDGFKSLAEYEAWLETTLFAED